MAPPIHTDSSLQLAPRSHSEHTALWTAGLGPAPLGAGDMIFTHSHFNESQDGSKEMRNSTTPHSSLGPHNSPWVGPGLSFPGDKGTGDSIELSGRMSVSGNTDLLAHPT